MYIANRQFCKPFYELIVPDFLARLDGQGLRGAEEFEPIPGKPLHTELNRFDLVQGSGYNTMLLGSHSRIVLLCTRQVTQRRSPPKDWEPLGGELSLDGIPGKENSLSIWVFWTVVLLRTHGKILGFFALLTIYLIGITTNNA